MFSGASQPGFEGLVASAIRAAERDGVVSDREQQNIDAVWVWLREINALASGEEPRFPITVPPSYWLDLREYRPPQTARELDMPLLILQGMRDEVLTVADVEGWGHPLIDREDAAFRGYRTHVHALADERELVVLAEDFIEGHVAANIISDIVAWIAGEFPIRLCQDLESWCAGCYGGPGARVGPWPGGRARHPDPRLRPRHGLCAGWAGARGGDRSRAGEPAAGQPGQPGRRPGDPGDRERHVARQRGCRARLGAQYPGRAHPHQASHGGDGVLGMAELPTIVCRIAFA